MQRLVGKWQLVEARAFDDAGNDVPSPFGPSPMGIMLFEAERMIGVVADGRPTISSMSKRALFSYTGHMNLTANNLLLG